MYKEERVKAKARHRAKSPYKSGIVSGILALIFIKHGCVHKYDMVLRKERQTV